MYPHTIRQSGIHEGGPIVQASPDAGRQPHREPAHLGLTTELDSGGFQAGTTVDEDLVGPIHHHISQSWQLKQRLQRPGPDAVTAKCRDCAPDGRVADQQSQAA